MELLLAAAILPLMALAPLLWRVRNERRARSWVRAGVALGLGGGDPDALRGVVESFEVTLTLRGGWQGPEAAVVLSGPTSGPAAAHAASLRRRIASQLALDQYESLGGGDYAVEAAFRDRPAIDAVLAGLRSLEAGGPVRLAVPLNAQPGDELAHLRDVLRLVAWVARELGWERRSPSEALMHAGLADPDALVRLRTLERMLGGWYPSGSVVNSAAADPTFLDVARRAAADPDPWVQVLGALHLGLEGLPVLHRVVRDREAPDSLVVRALAGVWDEVPATTLVRLLDRSDPEIVERAARGLQEVGTPAAMWALRRRRGPGRAGQAIERAIHAIEARWAEQEGRLSEADPRAGGMAVQDLGGDVSTVRRR